jgi:predicted MPP superfamily phosphohydrolase
MYLCGHTHGGQMFPMHLTSYLSSKCFKGLYEEKGKFVYVSEGLGTALFPIRIGSFSRIGVIKIEKE